MRSRYHIIAVLVFHCSLLIVNCSLSYAQWGHSADSNLLIGYGQAPRIISDENGGCFVNWFTGSHSRIQKVDKWGFTKWTPGGFYVGGTDTCAQDVGHMAYDGNGGVFVSFMDICCIANCETSYPVETYHCMIQHIDSSGNMLWGIGMEPSTKPHYQCYSIALAPDDSGGVYVAFSMDSTEYGNTKIYLQRLDAQGNRLWGNEGIDLGPGGFGPMVSDGNGGIIYAYSNNYLQRRNKNSGKIWADTGTYVQTYISKIVTNKINYVYVTGKNYIGGEEYLLKVQNIDFISGSVLWPQSCIIVDTLIIPSGIHDFAIDSFYNVWISWYNDNSVSIQKITNDGLLFFSPSGIQPSNNPSQKGIISLKASDQGSMFVAWPDYRNTISNGYAQRISSTGEYLWTEDVRISSTGGPSPITYDCNNGIIGTWERLSNFGIYVQQLSVNGNLGEVITTSIKDYNVNMNSKSFDLINNYPNPFNNSTTIKFINTRRQKLILSIYNTLGQKIKTIYSSLTEPGQYIIQLNMNGLATGVYLYKLDNGLLTQTNKLLYLK